MKELEFVRNMFAKNLNAITLFVTSRCNSRCKGCFYMKSLNAANDISLEQLEKIFSGFPKFKAVLISGGEPFIRNDIVDVIKLLARVNGIDTVCIPTNGLLTEKIAAAVKKMLVDMPKLNLGIYLSIDGLGETHDKIRGIPGNFKTAMVTLAALKKLKQTRNFNLTVNTTIMLENYKELERLTEYIKGLGIDNHTFDILRVVHNTITVNLPPMQELKKINKLREKTKVYYAKNSILSKFHTAMKERYMGKVQLGVLKGKKWNFGCVAGQNKPVVYANGDFSLCELLPPLGNLKEKSFGELWNSELAKQQREAIKNHACDCTHICYLSASIDRSAATSLMRLPSQFLKPA